MACPGQRIGQRRVSSTAWRGKKTAGRAKRENPNAISAGPLRALPFPSDSTWRDVWMLSAAGILLFVTLSFYTYRVGVSRGTDTAKFGVRSIRHTTPTVLEAQLIDATHDRQIARAQVEQGDQTIADLRRQLAQQSVEINQMKAAQTRVENDLRAGDATRQDLIQQRTGLTQKLAASQISFQALQEKLDSLAQQSPQDAARAQASEAKVNELTRLLHDREAALDQKDELLAHDRDIRELMGARDLYVAEVYNVVRNGDTEALRPRVLYEGEVADLLRVRSGSAARRKECHDIPSLGPPRTRPRAGPQPRRLLRRQCFQKALDREVR